MSSPSGPTPSTTLDTDPRDSARDRQALDQLWDAALRTYSAQTGKVLADSHLARQISDSESADAVSAVIEANAQEFELFRSAGGKTKEFLKESVPILKKFASAGEDLVSVRFLPYDFITLSIT